MKIDWTGSRPRTSETTTLFIPTITIKLVDLSLSPGPQPFNHINVKIGQIGGPSRSVTNSARAVFCGGKAEKSVQLVVL